jgi:hypothetical protein
MRDNTTLVLGIGAPRSGTTWLATYLEHHPQFYMSPLKEMHYFDAKFLPERCAYFNRVFNNVLLTLGHKTDKAEHVRMRVDMIGDESLYLQYFKRYMADERCFGEISPSYCLLECDMVKAIMAMHHKVKFIYILRSPVDRFISNSFYMANTMDMYFRYPDQYIDSCLHSSHLRLRADYRKTIQEYDRAAPDNILYLFYEQLFCDETLRRVCTFCGIDFRSAPYAARINASSTNAATELHEATRHKVYRVLAEQYTFVDAYFGRAIPENWREDMVRFQRRRAGGKAPPGTVRVKRSGPARP